MKKMIKKKKIKIKYRNKNTISLPLNKVTDLMPTTLYIARV